MFEDFYNSLMIFSRDLPLNVANNSDSLLITFLQLSALLGIFLWIYCGFIVYKDALRRFHIQSPLFYFFLFFTGFILGPFGLIVYIVTRPRQTLEELDFIKIEHKFYINQASRIIECGNCKAYVLENQLFCTNCGFQNRFKCKICSTLYDKDDLFCSGCGKELHHSLSQNPGLIKNVIDPKMDYFQIVKSKYNDLKSKVILYYNQFIEKKKLASNSNPKESNQVTNPNNLDISSKQPPKSKSKRKNKKRK